MSKLFSVVAFSELKLGKTEPVQTSKGRGGANHDAMLWGIIQKAEAFFDELGSRSLVIVQLWDNVNEIALTGIEGKYLASVIVGENEIIGPLGCPSIAKIMTHLGLGVSDILPIEAPVNIASVWNDSVKPCGVRRELAKQLTIKASEFKKNGDPFLKFVDGTAELTEDGETELVPESV